MKRKRFVIWTAALLSLAVFTGCASAVKSDTEVQYFPQSIDSYSQISLDDQYQLAKASGSVPADSQTYLDDMEKSIVSGIDPSSQATVDKVQFYKGPLDSQFFVIKVNSPDLDKQAFIQEIRSRFALSSAELSNPMVTETSLAAIVDGGWILAGMQSSEGPSPVSAYADLLQPNLAPIPSAG